MGRLEMMDRTEMTASPPPDGEPLAHRLVSLDALRGFDMFWILGIEGSRGLVNSIRQVSDAPWVRFISREFSHSRWEGFTFCDLIFPLFVFLAGVSIPFSLTRIVERSGKGAAHARVFRRFLVLYALGVFYYGGVSRAWPHVRLVGVLQRIAVCYLFAALIFCHFRLKTMIVICAALLVGYWAMMTFIPVPGVGTGCFDESGNLARYVDEHYLPGWRINDTWDPEGLLSTLPAIGSCLIGVFAGLLVKSRSMSDRRKVAVLLAAGGLGVGLGFLWGLQFPVIKKLWTSSYVLVAGGYSCVLLGLFYLVLDVWKLRAWAKPFVWIGTNALVLYLAYNIIDFRALAARLVGGDIQVAAGRFGPLLVCTTGLALVVGLAGFLHRRKIFIRA